MVAVGVYTSNTTRIAIGEVIMKTLPDYLRPGLDIVSVGLNPSLNAVKAGYYFATPQNRFWKALNASGLVGEVLNPGAESMQRLFDVHQIGFTDVVKRPSRGMAQLRAGDFREWAPILERKLLDAAPRIAWFHGKVAYRNFLRHTRGEDSDLSWGRQAGHLGAATVCFVTPNPSPANASFSLADLIAWYARLAELRNGMS